jgi:putative tricarboxylic transport membrane protein
MTGFIPTLTLGIPSTPSMVLMAGALIVQGITPGPALMSQHPDLFWVLS